MGIATIYSIRARPSSLKLLQCTKQKNVVRLALVNIKEFVLLVDDVPTPGSVFRRSALKIVCTRLPLRHDPPDLQILEAQGIKIAFLDPNLKA